MKTDGHYDVARYEDRGPCWGEVKAIVCNHCGFSVAPRRFHKAGDRSGQGRYNRARAVMVRHLHAEHRDRLAEAKEAVR